MKNFNLDRFNLVKAKLGEKPITLKTTSYNEPIIKDGLLVDEDGNSVGTKGDMYTKMIMDMILQEGCPDLYPRPHYEDEYKDAKFDKKKNTIITAEGEKIELADNE